MTNTLHSLQGWSYFDTFANNKSHQRNTLWKRRAVVEIFKSWLFSFWHHNSLGRQIKSSKENRGKYIINPSHGGFVFLTISVCRKSRQIKGPVIIHRLRESGWGKGGRRGGGGTGDFGRVTMTQGLCNIPMIPSMAVNLL